MGDQTLVGFGVESVEQKVKFVILIFFQMSKDEKFMDFVSAV